MINVGSFAVSYSTSTRNVSAALTGTGTTTGIAMATFNAAGILSGVGTVVADGKIPVQETVSDSIGINEIQSAGLLIYRTIADALTIDDVVAELVAYGIVDEIQFSETLSNEAILQSACLDTAGLTDGIVLSWYMLVTENANFDDSNPSAYITITRSIADALTLTGVAPNWLTAVGLVSEAVVLNESLAKGFLRSIAENINVDEVLSNRLDAAGIIADAITVSDILTKELHIFTVGMDNFAVDDTLNVNQILQALVEDDITFLVKFGLDREQYYGWVMNSSNRAVSRYDNYNFNSLARFDDRYFGAKADGVYELTGTKDDASFIQATIRTAKLDFESSNKKSVTQAYLGFTSDGSVVLKAIVDDDVEAWYELAVTSTGIHTDRIKLGKGLSGRYWQFELVTKDSTELELDTMELFPIQTRRKL